MSRGVNLLEILASVADPNATIQTGETKPKPTLEESIAALKGAAKRYAAPIPFKRGDLVTPRAGSTLKNAGQPAIVLTINLEPDFDLTPSDKNVPGSHDFGARYDMRVARMCDCGHGEILPHWVESWMFEPYVAPEQPQPDAEVPASAA